MILYGRQHITEEDIEAVVKVLRSDFLTQGPVVPAFEQKLCDYTGAKHAVAVNSCTSALHIACLALGLGPGDTLWTSPITFVASTNCALYCGASVDFVDIEPDTALMSVDKLEEKLKRAEKEGKLPKIVITVHFAGQPCDMEEIHALSQQYGFKIIEDAAHAIGAEYKEEKVGSCRYSDITVFSFHPVKIITTGEGGVAMTNDLHLSEKMEIFRSHGITRDPNKMKKNPSGYWYYEQIELGFNYRMSDIQAALGLSQMERLDPYVLRRNEIASWYDKEFSSENIEPLVQKKGRSSAYHLYVVRVSGGKKDRDSLYNFLHKNEIGVNLHYIPINRQPFYSDKLNYCLSKEGANEMLLEQADIYYSSTLTIPLYPNLKQDELLFIVRSIYKFFYD